MFFWPPLLWNKDETVSLLMRFLSVVLLNQMHGTNPSTSHAQWLTMRTGKMAQWIKYEHGT